MAFEFSNVYDDEARADAYATLEFPGTYYLAYRDLPEILESHVRGRRALDFGCGTGRSTRFLRNLGYDTVGIDIAEPMLARARAQDPQGRYLLVPDGDLSGLSGERFDLITSIFTFDNVPTRHAKVSLFTALRELLDSSGRMANLVSSPQLYVNEWASFSTVRFPENLTANSGDRVCLEMLDVEDRRPVEDVLWSDVAYREVFHESGLRPIEVFRPLGSPSDGFAWVSETTLPPWVIYLLGAA